MNAILNGLANFAGGAIAPGSVTNSMLAGAITFNNLIGSDIVITESQVTNLTTDLAAKQAALISGSTIKTIGGTPILGSGDIPISPAWSLTGTAGTDGGVTNFIGTTDLQQLHIRTNNVDRLIIDALGNTTFGNTSTLGATNPVSIDLGGTYGTSNAGSSANLKLKMYNDGSDTYGFGLSGGKLEYQVPATAFHVFYIGGTEVVRIGANGFSGINNTGTLTNTGSGSFIGLTNAGSLTNTGSGSFAGLINSGTLTNTGNALFGEGGVVGSTTPFLMDFGATYGTAAGGSISNLKLKIFNDGATPYGFGLSGGKLEYQIPASASHVFYVAGTEVARIGTSSTILQGQLGVGIIRPATSAIADFTSTTQGFLPPRMTSAQANTLTLTLTSADEALMLYVIDTNTTFTAKGWWGWDGAAWQKLNN
ncbi:MAG: hypothetical protein H7320_19370 [Ferruginibacter sp.]|nr:hypothetical protein [Ferruginibacter sp.]